MKSYQIMMEGYYNTMKHSEYRWKDQLSMESYNFTMKSHQFINFPKGYFFPKYIKMTFLSSYSNFNTIIQINEDHFLDYLYLLDYLLK